MSDYVTLSCPSCGGKLEITSHIDRFACAHCGTEHIVRRSGGLVSLAPVTEEIRRVRTGVDRTAAELAMARLMKEIETLEEQKPNAVGSGCGAFLTGTIAAIAVLAAGWGIEILLLVGGVQVDYWLLVPPVLAVIVFFIVYGRVEKADEKRRQAIMEEINQKHTEIEGLKRRVETEEGG